MDRRWELINKQLAQTITDEELEELKGLESKLPKNKLNYKSVKNLDFEDEKFISGY